ncbi:hypothetical protein COBT_004144, partial [Conglomerata obtusa]
MHNTSKNIDSFMYQSIGSEIIEAYSKCLNVPLYTHNTSSKCLNQDLKYTKTKNDEVEDLFKAIYDVKLQTEFDAVSSGAILSEYQKNRVENVCNRLGLSSLTPLWNMDQEKLLNDMINCGLDAKIVKIAADGFEKECVGFNLTQMKSKIESFRRKGKSFYFNFCGEGGEYESMVCYAPWFKKRILIEEYDICMHPEEKEKDWN